MSRALKNPNKTGGNAWNDGEYGTFNLSKLPLIFKKKWLELNMNPTKTGNQKKRLMVDESLKAKTFFQN